MDLRELMNHGFLIYNNNATFALKKIPTPTDPRTAITHEVVADTSILYFPSYEEALEAANKQVLSQERMWDAQAMYQHPGLGAQILNLPQVAGKTYEEALESAKSLADKLMIECGNEGVSCDVRIRPAQK